MTDFGSFKCSSCDEEIVRKRPFEEAVKEFEAREGKSYDPDDVIEICSACYGQILMTDRVHSTTEELVDTLSKLQEANGDPTVH